MTLSRSRPIMERSYAWGELAHERWVEPLFGGRFSFTAGNLIVRWTSEDEVPSAGTASASDLVEATVRPDALPASAVY
jgi:hypothetical protein